MAPIPASLQIQFTSNYPVGCHRVYYRIQGSGAPYSQITVNCTPFVPPGSQLCTANIPIIVDNESCDNVTYEGYVQACCEADGSPNGQVPFTVTFTPNPACQPVQLNCNNVGISQVLLLAPNFGGSGYDPMNPPNVAVVGGGGVGAIVNAVVGDTGVDGITITNGGAGYTDGNYTVLATNTLTGVGTGLFVHLIISGGVIVSATPANPTLEGSGYLLGDTFDVTDPSIGPGLGLLLTVASLNTSKVIYYTVINPGSGFSSIPTIVVDPSPGFGGFPPINALGEALLFNCPEFPAGLNCDGTPKGAVPIQFAGTVFELCYNGGLAGAPAIPSEYGVTPGAGCCYDCKTHTITFTDPIGTLTYTDCATMHTTTVNFGAIASPYVICAVAGSIAIRNGDMPSVNVVVGADCP